MRAVDLRHGREALHIGRSLPVLKVIAAALLADPGCGSESGGAGGVDAAAVFDGAGRADMDAPVPWDAETSDASVTVVRLLEIEQKVFAVNCTFSVCHGGGNPQKGMGLEAPTFKTLVSVPSTEVPGKMRISPGKPDESYLLEKIERDSPTFGKRMPPDQPLDPATTQLIRAWIQQGASNN